MSIPLVSNVGFTEITQSLVDSNSGVLNDIAGTTVSKLPLQIFKLTENITGNLKMNADSAHKKIILDTNGLDLTNTAGSPITNNSSTTLELKGSGNVQNALKTFTESGSGIGSNTIDNTDSSTIAVTNSNNYPATSVSGGYSPGFGTGSPNSSSIFVIADGQSQGPNGFGSAWRLRVPSGQTWQVGSDILSSGTTLTAAQNNTAIGSSSSFNKITSFSVTVNDYPNVGDNTTSFPVSGWSSGFSGNSYMYEIRRANLGSGLFNALIYNTNTGRWEGWQNSALGYLTNGRRGNTPPPQLITLSINLENARRTFTFTNNLSIACVLTGGNPYTDVTVNAGDTAVSTVDSSSTSFSVTGTISGNDGSSRPFALGGINDGTGSIDETNYTGTRSASAF
jgi:hypothetical protein